jgi:tetratricopeptide (TPR) repeat protein
LAADNYDDLGIIVPKLLSLGAGSAEAHGLAGKWAFGIEDWNMARTELDTALALGKRKRTKGAEAAAVIYLKALLLIREGKREAALPLLEEAVSLEDYGLFRFKLAENRFLLGDNPDDPLLRSDLEAALALDPNNGWINNFAAQLCLRKGDLENAAGYLENAAASLGDVSAIRMNRAELLSLKGSLKEALKILEADKAEDPDGTLANCAGNLLVKDGRYEDADAAYRKALAADPLNTEYLSNRAS